MDSPQNLTFGEYRLDPVRGQLYRGDQVVPLAPKAFALLQYMAAQPGRLIPKQELLKTVWPGVYVTDAVLKTTVRDLRQELAQLGARLERTSDQLRAREATLNSILEPGVQLFQLTASGDPDPLIQLFWDRQRHRAVMHGFRIDSVPAGRAYQLWFIKDGAPVPSVTFRPEPTGHVLVEGIDVPADGEITAAALTVEPESGSPQPTSPIRMVGPLKRSS